MKSLRFFSASALAFCVAHSLVGLPRLVFDHDELRPWRIVHARVADEGPMDQTVAVIGTTWRGGERLLFETIGPPGLDDFDIAFYLDDEIKSIALNYGSGSGAYLGAEMPVGLAAGAALPALPYHVPRNGLLRAQFVPGAELALTARAAAEELFVSAVPWASALAIVGAAIGSAFGLALLGARRMGRKSIDSLIALIIPLAAVILSFVLLPRQNEFFAVCLDSRSPQQKVVLSRRDDWVEGWLKHSWGDGIDQLIGLRLSPGNPVPLDLVDRPKAKFRFSAPPLIRRGSDGLALSAPSFIMGWSIHE